MVMVKEIVGLKLLLDMLFNSGGILL